MNSHQIRQQFLDFFKSKQHEIVASSPIVVKNDPTLLFTNAGMNQFKEFFLGNRVPKHHRIADTQKCLRVSGKHNDLEEVGKDTYHHTMFEMLGNWSFGDYFKKEAIEWAWELLTEVYKIDKSRLYVTVFEGSTDDNLEKDEDAYQFWKSHIAEDRILLGNKKDNFWEMGDQGPCGPCSEIHVDIRNTEDRAQISGASLVNKDHPQVVEIWNLVFMEFNRKADGKLEYLPAKHVDTGMGFERLCMVLQGTQSNYDTDVFTPMIRQIEKVTGVEYGKNEEQNIAIRVIADHIRAVSFAIADGQLPSNGGAGYVIRRILRRAVRYGFTFLNQKDAFIYQLIPTLVEEMGDTFPELKKQQSLVNNVIKEEEYSFLRTLDQGLQLLERIVQETNGKEVSGKKAFELFDTYGFPKDLTALILSEKGMTFNEKEFDAAMLQQKERSRDAAGMETEDWTVLNNASETEFVGYDTLKSDAKILRYRKVTSKKDGEFYQIVLDKTPFYAESGGQVGDGGWLIASDGNKIGIFDVKKENSLWLHFSKLLPNNINQTFVAQVDEHQRHLTQRNHSATHLLHQALRTVLGTHVEQKGSAVNSKGLRFDFSHFAKLTDEDLQKVEDFANERIQKAINLQEHRNIPISEAMEKGAMALFGEKYGDNVRMIQFNDSLELCGGTHVKNTGEIWYFKIVSESAIAAGVRRIEAITSNAAQHYLLESNHQLNELKSLLKNPKDVVSVVHNMQEEINQLRKEMAQLQKTNAKNLVGEFEEKLENRNGIQFLATKMDLDTQSIKDILFEMGGKHEQAFLLIANNMDGKATLSCYISKSLVEQKGLHAGNIVRELAKHINGGGGGQPFFATAGGSNPGGIDKALEEAKKLI
jgi:alanyl-tRNA synthetase